MAENFNLKLLSYNSTGFNAVKGGFLAVLMSSLCLDFLCIQEHFLMRSNVFKLENEFSNLNSFIVPAIKQNNYISTGRASGGLAIFWKNSLNYLVKQINHQSSRVQAVEFDSKIIIINCYFPCDTQNNNFNETELIKCLEDITNIISSHPNHKVIIAGDLNCDFIRNTAFVNIIRDFIMDKNLTDVWWSFPVDFTYSFTNRNRVSHSTIDHFLISDTIQPCVNEASVIHLGDNLSNHEPIFLSLNITDITAVTPLSNTDNQENMAPTFKPCWNKATPQMIDNYKHSLMLNTQNIAIPEGIWCQDVNCTLDSHRLDIQVYCDSLLLAIDSSTVNFIPPVSKPGEKRKPGWLEFVKPFQEDAQFYYAVWQSYGKPLDCPVHYAMKRTRNAYHYAVRRLKRNADSVKNDKLLEHCLSGNSSNIIKELKKQNPTSQPYVSSIDGHTGSKNISNHFCDTYKHLYQKHGPSDSLNSQVDILNANINNDSYVEVDKLTSGIVYQAFKTLKSCKNDNIYNFKSDALINGKDILVNDFTILFKSFLVHGFTPKNILTSSLQPIIKDKLGSKCDSSNYRAIGGSSLILKLFDIILLNIFGDSLCLAEEQYGFQRKSSTTLCSWTAKETINYFLNRDTPVFACFIDMTKAFDLVNYGKLFDKLKSRITPLFLRLLAYIYSHQRYNVAWNSYISPSFNVYNGVKQGGILSPTLFSIYIDDFFDLLKVSGLGCNIRGYFYGAVSYADDIVLLSPSRTGLQKMIDLAKSYFDNLDLIISMNLQNPAKSKTKCMAFGMKYDPFPLYLDDNPIAWTDKYTHLGHVFTRDGSSMEDCSLKKRGFIGKFHSLGQLLENKHPKVYMKLINIYMSDFYGSNLWDLFHGADNVYTEWNKCVRFVFKLPLATHRYFIEPLSEAFHLKTNLICRFAKFYSSLLINSKPSIHNLLMCQEHDVRSDFGSNVQYLLSQCPNRDISHFNKRDFPYHPINNNNIWRVDLIKELMKVKYNTLSLDYSVLDVNNMILFLTCN